MKILMVPAPIILFVFNRLDHTQLTIEALKKNALANESALFIYSDGPRKEEDKPKINALRSYLHTVDGFKSVELIERQENFGLAKNIINGVSKIVNEYGKIIVLEDDILTSPLFLTFMNKSLDYYEHKSQVFHISGWNYPIQMKGNSEKDVFLWRFMNCWGWATWKDRWQHFEKNPEKLVTELSKRDIKRFNLDATEDFWSQVERNYKGDLNTWAIFWYATIFNRKGLCVNPFASFATNIGFDGSGENCLPNNDIYLTEELNNTADIVFDNNIEENSLALSKIQEFYKSQHISFLQRVINKLKRSF